MSGEPFDDEGELMDSAENSETSSSKASATSMYRDVEVVVHEKVDFWDNFRMT